MSKSRKHQKSRARKTTRRKSRGSGSRFGQVSKRLQLRAAGRWPLLECLISEDWRNPSEITQIAIIRQSRDTGEIAVGGFLVDLGCLGVKNALSISFSSVSEYRRGYRESLTESQPMTDCDLDLAAKVVDEAIKYAKSLGFNPHRDARDAFLIMGEAHPENCDEEIPLGGEDGQPFFIAGPHDDPKRIMRILDRNVGTGNYHFLAPVGPPDFFNDDDILDFIESEDWEE